MKSAVAIILKALRALTEKFQRLIEMLESINWKKSRESPPKLWIKDVNIPSLYLFGGVAVFLMIQNFAVFKDWMQFLSHSIMAVGLLGFFGFTIYKTSPDVWSDCNSSLLLVFLLMVNIYGIFLGEVLGLSALFSSTAIVLLFSLVFPKSISAVFSIFSILISFVFLPLKNWHYFIIYIISAFGAILFSSAVQSRRDVIHAGFKISVINVIIVALGRELEGLEFSNVNILLALTSGIFASAVNLMFLPHIESAFSILSPISLVEMSDTNKPLLKRMMLEAPGTYHHSLITASLAEAACDAIGASGALARVGAYYHDIGKLFKPEYFIENQVFSSNPHDTVSPSMSGMVLMAHVKEGVELARKNKLNKKIIEFIDEHHGTSLIVQFFHKAVRKDISVEERDFRYSGVKPRSRETAVVMLADSVEAASRGMASLKPAAVADMVKKVINNKFVDGQLNDSPLTLRDLETIAEVMSRVLCGVLHVRYQQQGKPAAPAARESDEKA